MFGEMLSKNCRVDEKSLKLVAWYILFSVFLLKKAMASRVQTQALPLRLIEDWELRHNQKNIGYW
ncbi:hypothetical protein CR513_60492, partial [Mucuna pruriens]